MSDANLNAGALYEFEELPQNVMNRTGKPEYWNEDTFILEDDDGYLYELEMAFKCTFVGRVEEEDGPIIELEGERV